MSAPIKTKEELTRLAWITELRRQGHRQCRKEYRQGTQVCAIGLLQEVAGIDDFRDDVDWIVSHIGLTSNQGHEVVSRNDGTIDRREGNYEVYHKHTFAEIADIVEGWFR